MPDSTAKDKPAQRIGRTRNDVSPRDRDEEILFIRIDRMEEIVAHLQEQLDRAEEAQQEMTRAQLAQERKIKLLEDRLHRLERRLNEGGDEEAFDGV